MGQNDRSETEMYKSFASDPKSIPDKLFVLEAWHGAQWEVAFSDLVIERVDDNDVKELAKMIRTDHQKASEKLRPIAKKLNVQLMDGLPPMKQAKLELLGKLSSDQLVKCYLANQRAMHAKDITSFGDHAVLAMNEEVKAFARDTLPTLREHGNHIIQIASTKGMTGDFVTAGGGSMNEPVNGQ